MKKLLFTFCLLVSVFIMGTTAMATERTEACKKLMNSVVETYYNSYGDKCYLDTYGYVWESDTTVGKDNLNVLTLTTRVYDYDTAMSILSRLGGTTYCDVPITLYTPTDPFYDIMVAVVKDVDISLCCARPEELYPSDYKVIGQWNSTNTDVLVFKANETESFRVYTQLKGIADGFHVWGTCEYGFIPEENFTYTDVHCAG